MVHYKLTYFAKTRSVCEATRLAFHYAGQEYEENGVERDQWPELKKKMFYGHMPQLEVEGKGVLYESGAIARYVGRQFGLMGKDDWQTGKIDECIDFFKDLYHDFGGFVYVMVGFMPGDKNEKKESVAKPAAETHFPKLSQILKENGSGFLVGNSPTIADFFHADFLYTLLKMAPELFEKHGDLKEYVKRIQSLPQLQDYIKSRPDSIF